MLNLKDSSENSEEYMEFLQKFEVKKTTDDCFTPTNIYEVVANYVAEHYVVPKKDFMRPFVPNGDYKKENIHPLPLSLIILRFRLSPKSASGIKHRISSFFCLPLRLQL